MRARRPWAARVLAGVAAVVVLGTSLLPTAAPLGAAGRQKVREDLREPLMQFPKPQITQALAEVSEFIKAKEARGDFNVNGKGLAVAVVDSGLRKTHVDFKGRVAVCRNFTGEGKDDEVADHKGHGTHVAGIIAANNPTYQGIAPGANLIPLKVLGNLNDRDKAISEALDWVLAQRVQHNITVVNLSVSDPGNYINEAGVGNDAAVLAIQTKISELHKAKVAVVVAAGNQYYAVSPRESGKPAKAVQGMGFPAVFHKTISVGAVYDAPGGPMKYASGAEVTAVKPDRICPFSQRLHHKAHPQCYTDIFAPGGVVSSTGIATDVGQSIQNGTSQAAPVVAGVVLLMQELHLKLTKELPTVEQLETWLKQGGLDITDDDHPDDNVAHTGETFRRLDALGALRALNQDVNNRLYNEKSPKK